MPLFLAKEIDLQKRTTRQMKNNYSEKAFSAFLLLFACTPAAASNTVLTYILYGLAILCVAFAVIFFCFDCQRPQNDFAKHLERNKIRLC